MTLEGTQIRLRSFTRNDRAVTLEWRNLPAVRDAVMGFRFPVTDVMEDRWYDKVLDGQDKSKVYFAIEALDTETLIGFCSFIDIDYQSSHAQFGIMIGDPSYHGRGIGSEVLSMALDYAFQSLNLNRVYALVRLSNHAAIKLFENAGLLHEGRLRNHYFVNGLYDDVVVMALLREEYNSRSS